MYSKEELAELIVKNPEEYNEFKKGLDEELDLTELDFSNTNLEEIDLSNNKFSFIHWKFSNFYLGIPIF